MYNKKEKNKTWENTSKLWRKMERRKLQPEVKKKKKVASIMEVLFST